MSVRAIRGATTVSQNEKSFILTETEILLKTLLDRNSVSSEDIICIFFSMTEDLNAEFPAKAARSMGLSLVPLLCVKEIDVPGSVDKCIRILVQVNSGSKQDQIKHVYLNGAVQLRDDLSI